MKRFKIIGILLSVLLFTTFLNASEEKPLLSQKKEISKKEVSVVKEIFFLADEAKEKLNELEIAIKEKKSNEEIKKLIKEYTSTVNELTQKIQNVQNKKGINKALETVKKITKKHTQRLKELLKKAPYESKNAIKHAIRVSKRGRIIASERLSKKLFKRIKSK